MSKYQELVEECIRCTVPETFDENTILYMAKMIIADSEACTSEEKFEELIVDFILDELDCDADEAKDLCRTMFRCLEHKRRDSSLFPSVVDVDWASREITEKFKDIQFGSDTPSNQHKEITLTDKKSEQKNKRGIMKSMEDWRKRKQNPPPPRCFHPKAGVQQNMNQDIQIDQFSLSIGSKTLLRDSKLQLLRARRYGLVGLNGIGKTVFLHALASRDIRGVPDLIHFSCVEQEMDSLTEMDKEKTVLEAVLEVDFERKRLMEELTDPRIEACRMSEVYMRLGEIGADETPNEVEKMLSGLCFSEEMIRSPVSSLSGGWCARVGLCRALFARPDVLLLDEPTNHLDTRAVEWLTTFLLSKEDMTIVVVSHSRDFLNDVCTDIIHFCHNTKNLIYYHGNYDTFEVLKQEKIKRDARTKDKIEQKKAHMQKFVDKFRYNAKRASMAQSRIKMIARLPMIEEMAKDPNLRFEFPVPDELPLSILRFEDVNFYYDRNTNINKGEQNELNKEIVIKKNNNNYYIKDINLHITMDTRIALCGVNGSGKTTFLKLLVGHLKETGGFIYRHPRLRIGYFSQHHVDTMELTLSPCECLQERYPEANLNEEAARTFLGSYGITLDISMEPMYCLSGGQKTRVALALIAFQKPHLLIMDEPTNHLDINAVDCLIMALVEFKAGIIIVSHDTHFLSCVCEEVWATNQNTIMKFDGDLDEYKESLRKQSTKR